MAEVIPGHSKIHVASLSQLPLAEWNALYAKFRENSSNYLRCLGGKSWTEYFTSLRSIILVSFDDVSPSPIFFSAYQFWPHIMPIQN